MLGAAVLDRPAGPHHLRRPAPGRGRPRSKHDAVIGAVRTTARGEVGLVTSRGRMIRLSALELPTLPPTNGAPEPVRRRPARGVRRPAPRRGAAVDHRCRRPTPPASRSARPRASSSGSPPTTRATATTGRSSASRTATRSSGRSSSPTGDEDLVFVTSDAQLLHFPAAGGPAAGPRGRRHGRHQARRRASGSSSSARSTRPCRRRRRHLRGSSGALPGTEPGSLKVTPYSEYPAKGRATGGVRCHRFLRGEDTLVLAWVGAAPGPGGGRQRRRGGAARGHRQAGRLRHPGLDADRRGRRRPARLGGGARVTPAPPRRPLTGAPPTAHSRPRRLLGRLSEHGRGISAFGTRGRGAVLASRSSRAGRGAATPLTQSHLDADARHAPSRRPVRTPEAGCC